MLPERVTRAISPTFNRRAVCPAPPGMTVVPAKVVLSPSPNARRTLTCPYGWQVIPALNVRFSLTPTRPVHVLPSLNDTEGTPSPKSLSGGFHQTICAWRTFSRTWRPSYAYQVSSPGQVPAN